MARLYIARLILFTCGLGLAACDKPDAPVPPPTASAAAVEPAAPPDISGPVATSEAKEPSTSRDPRRVVVAWASAMSLRDWPTAYRYWGDRGTRSGQTEAEFAAQWAGVADPQFDIGEGQSEGAAGSLFYTAPITLIDGTRRVEGEIVLRRVNDVPGATAEQLRWHIDRLDLKP